MTATMLRITAESGSRRTPHSATSGASPLAEDKTPGQNHSRKMCWKRRSWGGALNNCQTAPETQAHTSSDEPTESTLTTDLCSSPRKAKRIAATARGNTGTSQRNSRKNPEGVTSGHLRIGGGRSPSKEIHVAGGKGLAIAEESEDDGETDDGFGHGSGEDEKGED